MYYNRSFNRVSYSKSVKSSKLLFKFTINELSCVTMLSLFMEKLLVGCRSFSWLLIYDCEGRYLSTINTTISPLDAVWTSNGNIVHTTFHGNTVIVMSYSGKVIATHTQLINPQYFSVADDGIIYLADAGKGVYQSTDNGLSWSLVFKSTPGWRCWLVIKVNNQNIDNFWTLEYKNNNSKLMHLRMYSVDNKCTDCTVTWKNVNVTAANNKRNSVSADSSILYDGCISVFLSDYDDKIIQVFSINGLYCSQLKSYLFKEKTLWKLAIDKKRHLLYVGYNSRVDKFELTYGEID